MRSYTLMLLIAGLLMGRGEAAAQADSPPPVPASPTVMPSTDASATEQTEAIERAARELGDSIGLEAEPETRRSALLWLVQHPLAADRFATTEQVQTLVEAAGEDQDPAWRQRVTTQLLFAPARIERLASTGQLDTLTTFLEEANAPGVVEFVLRDGQSVNTLFTSGELPLLLALLDAAATEQHRMHLLHRLLADTAMLHRIIAAEKLEHVLHLLRNSLSGANRLVTLTEIFHSGAMPLLMGQRGLDELIVWLRQEPDAELRGRLLGGLMSSPHVQRQLNEKGQLKRIVEVAAGEPQLTARRGYLETLLERSDGSFNTDRAVHFGLWELVKADGDAAWQARTIVNCFQNGLMFDVKNQGEEVAWMLETARSCDLRTRTDLLEMILADKVLLLAMIEHGDLGSLLGLIQQGDDESRGRLLMQWGRRREIVEYLASRSQLTQLLSLAKEESSDQVRQKYLQSLVGNSTAVTSLVDDGRYDALEAVVLAIHDADARAAIFGWLAGHDSVTQHLSKQNRLETLLEFAETQDTPGAQEAFLNALVSSRGLPTLIEAGHFDRLSALFDMDEGNVEYRRVLLAKFYSSPAVIEHFVKSQQIARFVELGESMEQPARYQFLQQLLIRPEIAATLVRGGQFDSLVSIIKEDPHSRHRGELVTRLVGNEEVFAYLADRDELSKMIALVTAESETRVRGRILQTLVGTKQKITRWIEAGDLDALMGLVLAIDDVYQRSLILGRVVIKRPVLERWAQQQRLPYVLELARSFEDFGEFKDSGERAQQEYLAVLFGDELAMQVLLDAGLFEQLLQAAIDIREPNSRGRLLGALVRHPETVEHLKSVDRLPQLISMAREVPLGPPRQSYLRQFLHTSKAIVALLDAGHHQTLTELVLESNDPLQRATMYGQLMQYDGMRQYFIERKEVDALMKFAEAQATTAARGAFLHRLVHSPALTFLLEQGHYKRLQEFVEEESQYQDEIAAAFYSHPRVRERIMSDDTTSQIIQQIESLTPKVRSELLQQLVGSTDKIGEVIAAGHLDSLLAMAESEPNRERRARMLGGLLGASRVVEYLATNKRLDRVVAMTRDEQDATARRTTLQRMLADSAAVQIWINSGMLDSLIELLQLEINLRQRAQMLGHLVTMKPVLEKWSQDEQLKDALALADSFGDADEAMANRARSEYLDNLFCVPQVLGVFLEAGLFEELLKIADTTFESPPRPQAHFQPASGEDPFGGANGTTFDPFAAPKLPPDPPGRRLRLLIQHPETLAYLEKQNRLDRLVEFVRREQSSDSRQAILDAIVQSEAIVANLIEAGQLKSLVAVCRQHRDQDLRNQMMGSLLRSGSAVQYMAEQNMLSDFIRLALNERDRDAKSSSLAALFAHASSLRALVLEEPLDQLLKKIDVMSDSHRHKIWGAAVTSPEVMQVLAEHDQLERAFTAARVSWARGDHTKHLRQQLVATMVHPELREWTGRPDVAIRLLELARVDAENRDTAQLSMLLGNDMLRRALIRDGQAEIMLDLLPLLRADDRENLHRQISSEAESLAPASAAPLPDVP